MAGNIKLVVLCCCLTYLMLTQAKIEEGTISSSENWIFVTRFCFLGTVDNSKGHIGRLEWTITYLKEYAGNATHPTPMRLLLYPDDVWETVYPGTGYSCAKKAEFLEGTGNSRTVSPDKTFSGCSEVISKGQNYYECNAGTTFGTPTEKWWYIVVENCASEKGIHIDYKMTMTNAGNDSIYFQHYSADEFFILQTDIGFLVVYVILIGLSLYVTLSLIHLQLFHTTYKIYLASLVIQVIALSIQVGFWSNYGQTGRPKEFWKYCGRFFEYVSTIIFVVLLLLMAKGYTITRGRIRKIGVIKLIVLSAVYCIVTLSMFIWEATSFDPGRVLYIYSSAPGYCLIAVRILAWLWFIYAIIFTVKNYTEKRSFYVPFFIIFSFWFWASPIMVFIAFDGIPKWTREKVVNGVNLFVVFFGHLVFLILTWPNQANDNFPYHVKTTQITDGSLGNQSRGAEYNPSAQQTTTNGVVSHKAQSIFTTQFNGTDQPVNIDRFPHATEDYIQERAIAMDRLHA